MSLNSDSTSFDTIQFLKKSQNGINKLNPLDNTNPQKSMLLHGFSSIQQQNYSVHPLEKADKSHHDRTEYRNMMILRSVQGIHAPLRLLAERKAASNIGHLPFLPRSNLMLEVLDGRDEMLSPNDIFADPREFNEVQLPAHLTMERQGGFL